MSKIDIVSETVFTINDINFSFRIVKSGSGPQIVISQERKGVTNNQMKFNISKESLRVLAIQLFEASKENYETGENEEAVFSDEKSTLGISVKDRLIEEGLKDTQFVNFLKENLNEKFGDSVSDSTQTFMGEVGKQFSKVEERVSSVADRKEVKDVAEVVQDIFGKDNEDSNKGNNS